ncbi:MAG TPA: hypothetical protein VFJ77_06155 [Gaiellaceae bacterium]|nr:hypothetical protein [Gaiellaceae bacterium]
MKKLRRVLVRSALVLAAAVVAAFVGRTALGSSGVDIGATGTGAICGGSGGAVATTTDGSATVPAGSWNVTSWSVEAASPGDVLQFLLLRPTGLVHEYTVVYRSAAATLVAGVNTFPLSGVEAEEGDQIAVFGTTNQPCGFSAPGRSFDAADFASAPSAGTTVAAFGASGYGINIRAHLDPVALEPVGGPPRVMVCATHDVLRHADTLGRFADIEASTWLDGKDDPSSPYYGSTPAIFVRGYGTMCRISDLVTYHGDPSAYEDAATLVDETGAPVPAGVSASDWGALYELWTEK